MHRTIRAVIGLMMVVIAAGIILKFVGENLTKAEKFEISNNHTYISGDMIIITWETTSESDGMVEYEALGSDHTARDYDITSIHRVEINKSTFPAGAIIPYSIESCSLQGRCTNMTREVTI